MKKELLVGCGSRIRKDLFFDKFEKFENVTTLDNNPAHHPDVLWDLTKHPLPFKDNEFDEIHAYEVLEHLAYQGNYEFFFAEFTEYARILKPNGLFFISVPAADSSWAWGDPSHKRILSEETFSFLNQLEYGQIGKTTMSDFRHIYKASFKKVYVHKTANKLFIILENVK